MAIWDDIRKGLKKIGSAASDGVKKVGNAANDGVNKVKGEARNAEKKLDKFVDSAVDKAEKRLSAFADKAEGGLKDTGKALEADAKKTWTEVSDAAERKIEAFLEAAAEEGLEILLPRAAKAIKAWHTKMKAFSESHPDLTDALNGVGFTLNLNIVKLNYENFYSRVENVALVLDELANSGVEFRRGPIIAGVRALGPDTIDPGFEIPLALCGIEFNGMSIDLFAELGDLLLEELGVPE